MQNVLLIVLDGFGVSHKLRGNAITSASTPFLSSLKKFAELNAAGEFVGLKKGFMGNSEVGHLHLGAGRLVKQDLVRISDAIDDGSFFKNLILKRAMKSQTVHLLGLISDGGVHSHVDHLFGLLELAFRERVKNLFVHAITDGRDMPPKSCLFLIRKVQQKLKKYNQLLNVDWRIASVIGRYYAMDRDNRWNREHKAYDALVNDKGLHFESVEEAVNAAYFRGESDEFISPSVVCEGRVKKGDSVIFFNFRSDRARELTKAFVLGKFGGFKRKKVLNLNFVCMTQYDPKISVPVAFAPELLKNSLGEVISKQGLRQFRLAETEKWAHVTFFFNGLSGRIFRNESRLLVPSPKVSTYDKCPEMSAKAIAEEAVHRLGDYGFFLINFANADMVGHTGYYEKTISAIETLDKYVKTVCEAALKKEYVVLITGDHGNAEEMFYPDGSVCTAHTTNKVPLFALGAEFEKRDVSNPSLFDVAPTILKLMNLPIPKEMNGRILVKIKS